MGNLFFVFFNYIVNLFEYSGIYEQQGINKTNKQ